MISTNQYNKFNCERREYVKNFRRGICLILTLALSVWLCACGQNAQTTWQEQYDLGVRYLSEGNYEEAIIAFTAAIEIDPKRPEAFIGRGDAYLEDNAEKYYVNAEKDYLTALELNNQLEEIYEKLSELYLITGDEERSLEILEAGAEVLNSESLREKAEQQRASAFSNQELINLAEKNIWTVYNLRNYIRPGACFAQGWDNYIEDEEGQRWFPVTDERVRTLTDITAYWDQYFSSRYPIPDSIGYQEIDGKLYSGCTGVGDDMSLLDYQLTDVQRRDGTSVVLTGYALRQEWGNSNGLEYRNHFRFLMDFEDGIWKCSGFEEGDRIYDVVPDELEQFPDIFSNTFWQWSPSPAIAYYAIFYGDGSFSYIKLNDLAYSIGTYEYDGETLYLNGEKYVRNGREFVSATGYDVMGGVDWHYTLKPDDEQRFLELEAQLHNQN